ncbi:MAG: DUF3488 domain-containing protein, partial [Thiobacillaceae bacterium]|nr:DUF3488 domain-containing protein [Thiobacillaceae bacterium]
MPDRSASLNPTAVRPGRRLTAEFWLLPPLTAALPLSAHLPGWLSLACVLLWGWRLALALGGRRLPPVWLRVILALAAVGAILLHYGLTLGRTGGVPLLTLLMFVKLLESDSLRHRRFSLLLAYFVL